jgi:NADPH:quinone reductase-like Zn-dependent oxidoreductase
VKALRLVQFGNPPSFELEDVPDPVPGPGEVVVDLRAAALNRRDVWVWTTPDYCPLPVTLGSDGAGSARASDSERSCSRSVDFGASIAPRPERRAQRCQLGRR